MAEFGRNWWGYVVQPSLSRLSCQESENYFHSAFKHGKTGTLTMLKIIWSYRKWLFFTCPSGGRRWPSSTSQVLPHMLAPLRSAAGLMPASCVLCLAAPRICHHQGCPSILNGGFLPLPVPLGQRFRNQWWKNADDKKMASNKDKSFQVMLSSAHTYYNFCSKSGQRVFLGLFSPTEGPESWTGLTTSVP